MKAFIEQFVAVFKAMPMAKKVTMAIVLAIVISGFAVMFFWANQIDYQPLYTNLTQEDAGEIVAKLREQRIPYRLEGGGTSVSVPVEFVYELRLSLAKEGLPAGGNVGFEIFDQTSFSTTEFVQRLNYQRALQGELVRTISDFREVDSARVLLAIPEESLFVEDSKPASASVLLKLRSHLSQDKVAGIVHLVSSAVEGLSTDNITVVDSSGNVLFKGSNEGSESALDASTKLDYRKEIEGRLAGQIQSMLEGIVGVGKAIVRVSADIDFEQVDLNEEKYDPDSSVVRSTQRKVESSLQNGEIIPQAAAPGQGGNESRNQARREDEVINYEINRITRRVIKPSGAIKRLSVAVAVDGRYEKVVDENGNETTKYVERTNEELQQFEAIVRRAMGYDADREDQVYVSSFSLPGTKEITFEEPVFEWEELVRQYSRTIINIMLVLLVFLFVVRPLIKSMKNIQGDVPKTRELPNGETPEEGEMEKLPEPSEDMGMREKTMKIARDNPERTEQLIRSWLQGD